MSLKCVAEVTTQCPTWVSADLQTAPLGAACSQEKVFELGDRVDVLSQLNKPAIIPHMADFEGKRFPYEVSRSSTAWGASNADYRSRTIAHGDSATWKCCRQLRCQWLRRERHVS